MRRVSAIKGDDCTWVSQGIVKRFSHQQHRISTLRKIIDGKNEQGMRLISLKKLLPIMNMNSRDRVHGENISFMFNVSNSSWHIIMQRVN